MGEEYRISSSVKVAQLEAELSCQLSALRELMGKKGVTQRTWDSGKYRYAAVFLLKQIHIITVVANCVFLLY